MNILQALAAATRLRARTTPALAQDPVDMDKLVQDQVDEFDQACALTVPDAGLIEVLRAADDWRRPVHFAPPRPDDCEPAPGTPPTAMDSLVDLPSWMRRDGATR